ncbi:MAG: GAF domain-containing protein [Methanosarcinaceae archaeon]|nr:GAF domain-containing protein [Methanosarcinaceae archaeon]
MEYQTIFEKSPVGILYFDNKGLITHCNESCSDILGSPTKKIVGFNIKSSLINKKLKETIKNVFAGESGTFEGECLSTITGKTLTIKVNFTPILDQDGSLLDGIGIFEDVAQRRQVEEITRMNELRLNTLLELHQMHNAPIHEIAEFIIKKAVELTDSKIGYLEFLNDDDNVLEMYYWPKDALTLSTLGDEPFVHPIRSTGLWGEAIRTQNPVIVNRQYTSDETDKISSIYNKTLTRHVMIPILENEQTIAVACVGNKNSDYNESDVHQLTLLMEGIWKILQYMQKIYLQKKSLKVHKVFDSIMTASPAIVFLWKPEKDWPVKFVSENIVQFGYSVDDFMSGKMVYGDIIHPSDLDRVRTEMNRASNEGFSDFSQEYRILTKSGEVKWVDERTLIHNNENGIIDYLQGIIVDITERKQANDFMRIESDLDNALDYKLNLQDAFESVLDSALETKAIDSAVLYLVDEHSGEFDLVAHRGVSERFVDSVSHFSKKTIIANFFMTGYPVYKYFSDISFIIPGKDLSFEGLQAMAFLPIHINDELVAAIALGSHVYIEIPANSRNLIETIANLIGVIISRMKNDSGNRKNTNNMHSLLDALDEIVFIIDVECKILHTNSALHKHLNYSDKDLFMKDYLVLYPPEQESLVLSKLDEIIEEKSSSCDIPLVSKEGIHIPVKTKFTKGDWGGKEVMIATASIVEDPNI